PSSVAKALKDPDWVAAMQEEMQQFYNQKVWKLVPLPDEKITIGTKWILKNKRDARRIVVRNKSRLVAQGRRQEEGIDYNEVFASVTRIEAIRLFLAFASYIGFMVYQMDVKSAFLYGEIKEEVYVTQSKGFEDPHNPKHIYRVVKALYGLHQAPRACSPVPLPLPSFDGPHMPLLAHILVVPAVGDGADAVAAGAAAAHNGLPPSVPPTHSSSSIPGPSSTPQSPPVREPSPVKEPTPVRESTPVWEPTPCPVREPTPDSPRPPFSPPRSEEVGPTTSTRPPSPTRHTSVHEDISEGGGDFVSSPQSNEASQTSATTAAGGAEDSAALIALSLKLHRCIHRVPTLKNELGVTKKVLGGAVLKLVTRVKRLEGLLQQRKRRLVLSDSEGEDTTPPKQDIDLEALYTLARTSLGGDSSYTSVGHDAPAVPADATMPFRRRRVRKPFTTSASAHVPDNIPTYADIPAAATTIPAGKAPMVDDSLPADLLFEQECVLKNLHDSQLGEKLAKKIHAEQEAEFARQQEERSTFLPKHTLDAPTAKRANQGAPQVPAASTQVPADVPAAPSFAADVSVSTATTPVVPVAESRPADTPTASAYVSVEHSVAASTQSSSRRHRKDIAKKWVTPIVDMADAALIKFDSDSGSDDDPLPYAPYAGWEMVPSPLGSVHAYHDMAGHTKQFTTLCEVLHMVEKTNLQKLQGASLDDEDAHDFWRNQDSWRIHSWRLYPRAQVHILETVDGRVIYMFVDVSYPLTVATLERMLKDGLEVPKLLVGGDLTMAEQLIGFIKVAILNAQSAV
nr:copia protein [Tanacetum cinerariifolium]